MADLHKTYKMLFDRFKVDAFNAIYKSELWQAEGDLTVAFADTIRHTMDGPPDRERFWQWYWQIGLPRQKQRTMQRIRLARQSRTTAAMKRARGMYRLYQDVRAVASLQPAEVAQ